MENQEEFAQLLRSACAARWVVYAKKPFAGPQAVLTYLSRYTHRVAIGNRRLLDLDEHAGRGTFSYKDYADQGRRKRLTLELPEFLRRFCLHILPARFVKIRHYGLLSNRHRAAKAKAATNPDLKAGFEEPLQQTEGHVQRLEQIAEQLGKKLAGHKCKAMEGLVEEGAELISEDAEDSVRDAGLIGAAQRVEHYEMAGYGTARALAARLGHGDIADLLGQALEEEKATDAKLTELAESAVNAEAEMAGTRK